MNETELKTGNDPQQPDEDTVNQKWEERMEMHQRKSRVWMGCFLLLVGITALAKSFHLPLPAWIFSWQMLLIAFGVFIALRHRFRGGGWILPILVGLAFLINDYFVQLQLREHLWPAIIIIIGLFLLFKPRSSHHRCRNRSRRWQERKRRQFQQMMMKEEVNFDRDDFLDATSIFGGSKKKIITKDFKGGDIVNVFGGTELDLTQADIQTRAELEVTAIFGGASLVVPSNWMVKSEVVTLFGGIQDKRNIHPGTEQSGKILVLKGTVIFGGIEIKSY